ncbi:ATP phosphoribosyltransferase [Phlyctema vagabunda]|uniref:ATP phosphoribosyltransferase n=1 Tax=Phlyctema vagabunda TaxID=108571 RepID=A0ABR4P221_9HELO
MLLALDYGTCELKLQVPASGSLKAPADLIGGTVCTSFVNLTRQYFSDLERQAGSDKPNELSTKIVELSGSVEAACALGVADGVVDLVESGETMIAAGLEDIATVTKSQAVLIKSPKSVKRGLITLIASRVRGFMRAENFYLCQCNVPAGKLESVQNITSEQQASSIFRPMEGGWQSMSTLVLKKDVALVMDKLYDAGASDILLLQVANSRAGPQHALF